MRMRSQAGDVMSHERTCSPSRGASGRRSGRAAPRRTPRIGACERLETRQLLAGNLIAQWVAESLNDRLPDGGRIASW